MLAVVTLTTFIPAQSDVLSRTPKHAMGKLTGYPKALHNNEVWTHGETAESVLEVTSKQSILSSVA